MQFHSIFSQKLKTHTRFIEQKKKKKNDLAFWHKILYLIGIKYAIEFPFWSKINHNNSKIFLFVVIFFKHHFSAPQGGVQGTCPLFPSPSYAATIGPLILPCCGPSPNFEGNWPEGPALFLEKNAWNIATEWWKKDTIQHLSHTQSGVVKVKQMSCYATSLHVYAMFFGLKSR